jgi:hypothetical protein
MLPGSSSLVGDGLMNEFRPLYEDFPLRAPPQINLRIYCLLAVGRILRNEAWTSEMLIHTAILK